MGMCDSGPEADARLDRHRERDALDDHRAPSPTIAAGSRSQPAPAPRPAILGTQQPQLMSMNAGSAASATRAASARRSGSEP